MGLEIFIENYLSAGLFDDYVTDSLDAVLKVAWLFLVPVFFIRIGYGFYMSIWKPTTGGEEKKMDLSVVLLHFLTGLILMGALSAYLPIVRSVNSIMFIMRNAVASELAIEDREENIVRSYIAASDMLRDEKNQEKIDNQKSLIKAENELQQEEGVSEYAKKHRWKQIHDQKEESTVVKKDEVYENSGISTFDRWALSPFIGALHLVLFWSVKVITTIITLIAFNSIKLFVIIGPLTIIASFLPVFQDKAVALFSAVMGMYGAMIILVILEGMMNKMSNLGNIIDDPIGFMAMDVVMLSMYVGTFKYGSYIFGKDAGSAIMQGGMSALRTGATIAAGGVGSLASKGMLGSTMKGMSEKFQAQPIK